MANRRITTMDIVELVRLLRAGESDRTIGLLVGHDRRTVGRYHTWAAEQGFLEGEMPTAAALHQRLATTLPRLLPPQQTSTLAAYTAEVHAYRQMGLEMAAIRARLEEAHGHPVSYSAVRRLVAHLEPARPREAYTRVEVKPGSEAQVDFGYAGLALDPHTGCARKSWIFTMVLSWSRHQYAEVVWDQCSETWLLCHRHAFEFFGAVPAKIVPDYVPRNIIRLLCPPGLCGRSCPPQLKRSPGGCNRPHNAQSEANHFRRASSVLQIGCVRDAPVGLGGSLARSAASFVFVVISA